VRGQNVPPRTIRQLAARSFLFSANRDGELGGGGLMLAFESGTHEAIVLRIFPSEDAEGAGEAVAEIVLRYGRVAWLSTGR